MGDVCCIKKIAMNTTFSKKVGGVLLLIGALALNTPSFSAPTRHKDVTDSAKKSLRDKFPEAENVQWVENSAAHRLTAYFDLFDIRTVANFDRDGNLISTIRYYKEDHLPLSVLAKLKTQFAGKSVAGVTEVSQGDDVTYFIRMEDAQKWYTVKVAGGDMTITESFDKA